MLPDIDFEGKVVKPKNGVYKCPFGCGDSRFPQPKWKTEAGFRKHMSVCSKSPSAILARSKKEMAEKEKNRIIIENKLAECSLKVGDTVFYVAEIITKPTHDNHGRRIRYEEEKYYEARQEKIESITWAGFIGEHGGAYFLNGHFWSTAICETREIAAEKAKEKTEGWRKHVEFSEFCR